MANISPEAVLAANHVIYWDYLGKASQEVAKCQVICTHIQTGWLNGVISHRLTAEDNLTEVVEQIVKYFQEHNHLPFSWWVEANKEPAQLAGALGKHKIVSLGDFSGMTLDLNQLKQTDIPDQLTIEPISTEKSMEEMVVTLIDAYSADSTVRQFATKLFWDAAQHKEKVMHFLGRVEGHAVTAGSLFINQRVACIYHVGTLHSARNKGYASFLMYTMLETAKRMGCLSSVLVSTPKGKNMYLRIGYSINSVFHHYMKIE